MKILAVFSAAALGENPVLVQGLGLDPLLQPTAEGGQDGVSSAPPASPGSIRLWTAGVVIVTTLSSALAWFLQNRFLEPAGLGYLGIVAFTVIILALARLLGWLGRRRGLDRSDGLGLEAVTTNSLVLGLALQNVRGLLLKALMGGLAAGLGWVFVGQILAGFRDRVQGPQVPPPLRGLPATLIALGLMALTFTGFRGMLQVLFFR